MSTILKFGNKSGWVQESTDEIWFPSSASGKDMEVYCVQSNWMEKKYINDRKTRGLTAWSLKVRPNNKFKKNNNNWDMDDNYGINDQIWLVPSFQKLNQVEWRNLFIFVATSNKLPFWNWWGMTFEFAAGWGSKL